MNYKSILIVEDEKNLGQTLQEYLESQGYETFWAQNLNSAQEIFIEKRPHIVLLDTGLPDGDGIEFANTFLKQYANDFVLLFLSAQNDPTIKVSALELGAYDYITKPFDLKELMLRLNRILEYSKFKHVEDRYNFGPLSFEPEKYEVVNAHGDVIQLTQKECEILKLMIRNKNRAVTRDHIIEEVWGEDQYPTNRTVDNYIVTLRKWSESDPQKNLSIQSIRGIGYKLTTKDY